MKQTVVLLCLLLMVSLNSGCVSASIASSTGMKLKRGMSRSEVHAKLGPPEATVMGLPPEYSFMKAKEVSFVDRHLFRGKVNYAGEAGTVASVSAMTLGVGELYMVPLTIGDAIARSTRTNRVDVLYNPESEVLDFHISPLKKN